MTKDEYTKELKDNLESRAQKIRKRKDDLLEAQGYNRYKVCEADYIEAMIEVIAEVTFRDLSSEELRNDLAQYFNWSNGKVI